MAGSNDGKPLTRMGESIARARLARGWSQQELANRAGTNQSTVDRIEKNMTAHSRALPSILKVLDIDQSGSSLDLIQSQQYWLVPSSAGIIPLFAAVEGGPGEMIVEKNPLSYVPRPHYLEKIDGAYAVYISGDSMFPEFEPGDTAHVNPRLPAIPDTTCVFYTNDATNDRATIKRLVRIMQHDWKVRQWNPPPGAEQEFELDRDNWPICHRVVGRVPRR